MFMTILVSLCTITWDMCCWGCTSAAPFYYYYDHLFIISFFWYIPKRVREVMVVVQVTDDDLLNLMACTPDPTCPSPSSTQEGTWAMYYTWIQVCMHHLSTYCCRRKGKWPNRVFALLSLAFSLQQEVLPNQLGMSTAKAVNIQLMDGRNTQELLKACPDLLQNLIRTSHIFSFTLGTNSVTLSTALMILAVMA